MKKLILLFCLLSNFVFAGNQLITASPPLNLTAGLMSMPSATGSRNGYLTSTDWNTFNSHSGSVSSVGLLDSTGLFTVTGSPVTTSGTLTFSAFANQSANRLLAGPTSGAASSASFRLLVGADLPNPGASSLGGIQSITPASHQWINSISTSGVPSQSQPAFTDISGSVAASQLPNPSSTTLGGVQSVTPVSNQWVNSISTLGVPSQSQPAFTNISGTVAASQLPNPSSSTLGGVQSYASVSNQWINTISTSGVPSSSQPAFSNLSGNISTSQMNSGTSASSSTFFRGDGTWVAPTTGLVEAITGFLEGAVADATRTLDEKAVYAYTINTIAIKLASGTATGAVQINGTNVTSLSALSLTSSQQTFTATGANSVAIGDRVTFITSAGSSPVDLAFTMKTTR